METINKVILLNAGTQTRRAFIGGIGNTPYEWYHTKNMALHIPDTGIPAFIYKNETIDFRFAHIFTRLRSDDQQFCGMLYDYFKYLNVPATDPINHSYENSAEKISQMLILALAGISIPDTIIFREEAFKQNKKYIEEHFQFPLVFKTDGSRGKNVHLAENLNSLQKLVSEKRPHVRALIQPFIPNEYDTRTLVAFGTILGTIKRTRIDGYLNNIAQGAIASVYELTEEEKRIAIQSAKVCGIDFAGVDMIHTEKGPVVLEVNKSPQVQGFESVHNFKVFEKVAELMMKK